MMLSWKRIKIGENSITWNGFLRFRNFSSPLNLVFHSIPIAITTTTSNVFAVFPNLLFYNWKKSNKKWDVKPPKLSNHLQRRIAHSLFSLFLPKSQRPFTEASASAPKPSNSTPPAHTATPPSFSQSASNPTSPKRIFPSHWPQSQCKPIDNYTPYFSHFYIPWNTHHPIILYHTIY